MPHFRFLVALIGGVAAVVTVNSCTLIESITAPCKVKYDEDGVVENYELLDGPWVLDQIDGKAIPQKGYDLPLTDDTLTFGVARFRTTDTAHEGKCEELLESRGDISFEFLLRKGPLLKTKFYPGRFYRDHEAKKTTIGANKYTLPATIPGSPPLRFTVSAELSLAGIPVTYTLLFRRTE